jgi:hypothetical protein
MYTPLDGDVSQQLLILTRPRRALCQGKDQGQGARERKKFSLAKSRLQLVTTLVEFAWKAGEITT